MLALAAAYTKAIIAVFVTNRTKWQCVFVVWLQLGLDRLLGQIEY
jgi:hypothetical protein